MTVTWTPQLPATDPWFAPDTNIITETSFFILQEDGVSTILTEITYPIIPVDPWTAITPGSTTWTPAT